MAWFLDWLAVTALLVGAEAVLETAGLRPLVSDVTRPGSLLGNASDEVKATIEESFKLADALGLNGTPSYVVGNDVVVGAVGLNSLKEKVNAARCGKPTC